MRFYDAILGCAVFATCMAQFGCKPEQGMEAVAIQPKIESEASTSTPEDALRHFMTTMSLGDAQGLATVTMNVPGIELLLPPQPLSQEQAKVVQQEINSLTITRLQVGDVFTLPDGTKVTMNDSMVNADRQQLVVPGSPYPFILVRSGEWRVDPSPLIAMRRAMSNQ